MFNHAHLVSLILCRVYNSHNGLDLLKECRVSQAQAWQRTGRAGRQRAGFCYRMYTEKQFNDFASHTVPELQRYTYVLFLWAITGF